MYLYSLLVAMLVIFLIFLVPKRHKVWVATGAISLASLAAIAVAIISLGGEVVKIAEFETMFFGMESFAIDKLSALMLIIISVASVATVLYSRGYVKGYLERFTAAHISMHYTALVMLVVSMMLVVMSSGGFSFLFSWELMTIASFILILFEAERQDVRRAALNYLVMMHIGFLFLVAGFVMIYNVTGSANFADIEQYFHVAAPLPLFVILFIGFGMKAGLFPMHIWLPEAHPAAPSHVSAIMSGVMIKTGVYGIVRLMQAIDQNTELLFTIGLIILISGAVTGLWGVFLAAMQNDIKRLLAYSSIENVGVILIGLGIAAVGHAAGSSLVGMCGMCGALLHMVNHSLFKSLLFFGAGNIYSQMHTTLLDKFGGVAKHMPVTAILFFIATLAICALPPLNGFVGEFLIYLGMLDSVRDNVNTIYAASGLLALALIGGIAVLAFSKLYSTIFLGSPRDHHVAESQEVDNIRIAAMAIPATGIILIGLFPQFAIRIVEGVAQQFTPYTEPVVSQYLTPTLTKLSLTAWLLIIIIALIYIIKSRAQRSRTIAQGPTWGCGFTSPNIRMQYTGESFAEGLESIATSFTQNTIEGRTVGKSEIFPSTHNYNIRHKDKIDRLFAEWWVELLHIINKRVMSLRTGKINIYIAYALIFLVVIFVVSLFNLI